MKDRRNKGRLPAFTALFIDTLSSPAWQATSHPARSLFTALKRKYNRTLCGVVYLSMRVAAKELGSSKNYVGRWFRELEYYGFIKMVSPGHLGVDGRGKAAHWRLTDEWYHDESPTRDFHKWNGEKFREQKPPEYYTRKKQNPVPQIGDSVSHKSGTVLSHKSGTPACPTVPQLGDIESKSPVPQLGDISSLTIPILESSEAVAETEAVAARSEPSSPEPADDGDIPTCLRRGHPDCAWD
jgi:hypothetical protein